MRQYFIYTPRSGSRLFTPETNEGLEVLDNGSYLVSGEVWTPPLEIFTAAPKMHFREEVHLLIESHASRTPGILAFDAQGLVSVFVQWKHWADTAVAQFRMELLYLAEICNKDEAKNVSTWESLVASLHDGMTQRLSKYLGSLLSAEEKDEEAILRAMKGGLAKSLSLPCYVENHLPCHYDEWAVDAALYKIERARLEAEEIAKLERETEAEAE